MDYQTKVTRFPNGFGCRIFLNDVLIVEGKAPSKNLIGPTFRDLFRTLDKMGGNKQTSAIRKRKFKEGNLCAQVKHIWHYNPGIIYP
jgi:hypothetical protein